MLKEEINYKELKAASRKIDGLEERPKNMRPVMVSLREQMRFSVDRNFEVGGRPRWIPSKKTKKGGGKTLIGKTRLWHDIQYKVGNATLTIMSKLPYSAAHQYGYRGKVRQFVRPHHRTIRQAFGRPISPKRIQIKKGYYRQFQQNIPARPYILVQTEDTEYAHKRMLRWIVEGT